MKLEVDVERQQADLIGDDGQGLALVDLQRLHVDGGRVWLEVDDGVLAAEFAAGDFTVVHVHPEPRAAQVADALRSLGASALEQRMLQVGELYGMDASPAGIALEAMAALLEEVAGGAQAEPG